MFLQGEVVFEGRVQDSSSSQDVIILVVQILLIGLTIGGIVKLSGVRRYALAGLLVLQVWLLLAPLVR